MDLSLVVIALNEEDSIGQCIESVPFADEVIVVDSGSTDTTVSVAESLGARVLFHDFESYSSQKQWAIGQASGSWILSLDADEYLDPELASGILSAIQSDTDHAGYSLRFRIQYMGRLMRYGPWSGERHTRLFRNGLGEFPASGVHESLKLNGSTGKIGKGFVIHRSYSSLSDQVDKMRKYSRLWADDQFGKGRRANAFQILLRPAWRFFSAYFLRGGFLEGIPGFASSYVSAYYVFLKWTMLYELRLEE